MKLWDKYDRFHYSSYDKRGDRRSRRTKIRTRLMRGWRHKQGITTYPYRTWWQGEAALRNLHARCDNHNPAPPDTDPVYTV